MDAIPDDAVRSDLQHERVITFRKPLSAYDYIEGPHTVEFFIMKFKDFQGTCQTCKYALDAELTWKGIPLRAGREIQQLLCQNKTLHYYSHFLF